MANLEDYTNQKTYIQEEVNLEKVRVAGRKAFGNLELESMRLERFEDIVLNGIVYQWSTICKGEKVRHEKQDVTFDYPATWWDHFKVKKFPKWLLKKFPVKCNTYLQTVVFKEIAVFPKLSNYISFNGQDKVYFSHTQCLDANDTYDFNMNIMEEN